MFLICSFTARPPFLVGCGCLYAHGGYPMVAPWEFLCSDHKAVPSHPSRTSPGVALAQRRTALALGMVRVANYPCAKAVESICGDDPLHFLPCSIFFALPVSMLRPVFFVGLLRFFLELFWGRVMFRVFVPFGAHHDPQIDERSTTNPPQIDIL